MDKAVFVGVLDLYRTKKPENAEPVEGEEPEEVLEPLPKISMAELWPPSPRVKMLYIGLGFFLFNLLLVCIWAWAFVKNFG
jgi:hypothetical protein